MTKSKKKLIWIILLVLLTGGLILLVFVKPEWGRSLWRKLCGMFKKKAVNSASLTE